MKRSPHLRRLSVEHQSALAFAARVERAAHAAPLSELSAWMAQVEHRWRTELEPHFAVEERVLLPALARSGLQQLTQRTIDEHRAIAAVATHSDTSVRTRLARFAMLLHAHVRFEERELFDAAQRALGDSELEALARAMCASA